MIIDPILQYIDEPYLTFANNQKAIDPRDGIMLYEPFDRKKITGQKTIGIIGPCALRESMVNYLQKLHSPIINQDMGRPNFPGLESAFGISVNFDNIPQIDIPDTDLQLYKTYADSYQRVHNWVNLFVDKLQRYTDNEEIPVDVWIIIIPEYIYQYGRPNSKVPKNEATNKIG